MAIPFLDNIDLKNNTIENVKDPVSDTEVSNKKYVDDSINTLQATLEGEITSSQNNMEDYVNTQIATVNGAISEVSNSIQPAIEENIVDNLYSADTTKSLSANQGIQLRLGLEQQNTKINNVNTTSTTPRSRGTYNSLDYYNILYTQTLTFNDIDSNNEIQITQLLPENSVITSISGMLLKPDYTEQYIVGVGNSSYTDVCIWFIKYLQSSNTLYLGITSALGQDIDGYILNLNIDYYTIEENGDNQEIEESEE